MGILASSASKTMTSSSSDDVSTGYVTHERVTLSTNPAPGGAVYQWGMSAPMGSALSRSTLTSYEDATPSFVPDVAGVYTVSCTVNGVAYVLRLTATSAAFSHMAEAIRLSPKTDASIPAPAAGAVLYYSATQGALCVKTPDNAVSRVNVTPV
jgi:hypothetical protein